jgi:hypothetical protein
MLEDIQNPSTARRRNAARQKPPAPNPFCTQPTATRNPLRRNTTNPAADAQQGVTGALGAVVFHAAGD